MAGRTAAVEVTVAEVLLALSATTHRNLSVTGYALVTMVTRLVLGYRRCLVRRCAAIAPAVVCARRRMGRPLGTRTVHSAYFVSHHVVPMRVVGVHRDDRRPTLAEHCARTFAPDLYVPEFEHDACGVAMVADLKGRRDHGIVRRALTALLRLEHRGARGAEVNTGDGAGILLQIPDAFFRAVVAFELPAGGRLRRGPRLPAHRRRRRGDGRDRRDSRPRRACACSAGASCPPTPTAPTSGPPRAASCPRSASCSSRARRASAASTWSAAPSACASAPSTSTDVYFPSLSPRTIVYKGMLSEPQVEAFYPDLSDERVVSALALVHSRFSTNTFPAWPLAHPYRYVAHNGEINTLRGNRNWMAAREALLASDLIPGDLARLSPIVTPDASDSATFDEVLELLHLGGRSLPHAVLMMIPEAWENHAEMDPARRAFYEFHSTLMEPWDGPALSRSPTAPSRAPCSTATACAPPATGSPKTGWSRWRPRSACWTSSRRRSCARAASSPAACSWSTRPQARSSTTRRSRARWPPSTPTRSGCTRA